MLFSGNTQQQQNISISLYCIELSFLLYCRQTISFFSSFCKWYLNRENYWMSYYLNVPTKMEINWYKKKLINNYKINSKWMFV